MEEKCYYKEVHVDDYDITIEEFRIIADGIVVALVDINGYVSYNVDNAKYCANVQNTISKFKDELKTKNIQYYLEY